MYRMNKIHFLALALLVSATASAQQTHERKGPPPPPTERSLPQQRNAMADQLQLTDAQKEQLKKEHEKAMDKVLTPEQKKLRKELMDKQAARKDSAQKRQAQKLKQALSLSDEQVSKLMDQQEKFKASMKKFRTETSAYMSENRQKLRTMMEVQADNLRQILNPEQFEKYKKMMQERMQQLRNRNPRNNQLNQRRPNQPRPDDAPDGPPPPPRPRKKELTESF